MLSHPFFRRVSIMVFLLCVSVSTTFAQTKAFRINSVDFSKFPKMRAYYEAEEVSPDGKERKPIAGLTNADFTLEETILGKGTKNYPVNAITQQCSTKKDGSAVRVVLILDNSGSMLQPAGETGLTRMDVIKNGAKSFVQEVDFIDSTAVAILSFESDAKLRMPFSRDVNALTAAIDAITPNGNTNYENPMIDPRIGAIKLLKETLGPPDVRRVIIFLTDGNPSGGVLSSGDNNEINAFLKDVETQMNDNSITFFAVTAFIQMNAYLERWARATGGRTFEVLSGDPKSEMENIYRLIAASISKKVTCWLEWTSEYGCNQDSRQRTIKISIPKESLSDNISVTAPDTTIASVRLSKSGLSFGNPPPNGTQQQTIVLTAEKSDVIISDPVFANTPCGTYRVVSPSLPALIRKGESVTFTLEFKQGPNQVYCPSTLLFGGTPCPPPQISLFGGVNSIQLIEPSPTVSSVFSSCEDINIVWEGVTPITKPIKIEYSSDNGTTWNILTNSATGGKFTWSSDDLKQLPRNGQFKLRLTEAASSKYIWAKSAGGTLADSVFTIAIGSNNDDLFISGIHRGTINFAPNIALTSPHTDFSGFIAKYGGISGTPVWAIPMTGSKVLKTYSATCNNKTGTNQRVYGTGYFIGDGVFGTQTKNQSNDKNRNNMFLVVMSGDGSVLNATELGSRANAFGEMIGTGVAFDPTNNRVYVRGIGRGKIAYQISTGEKVYDFGTTVSSTEWREFTAEFDEQGVLLDVRSGVAGSLRKLWPGKTVDVSDGTYSVDTYAGTRKFTGTTDLVSAGSTDGFVAKFGVIQGSNSTSVVPFNIAVAKLEMRDKSAVFQLGQVAVGDKLTGIIGNDKGITNTGNIPTKVIDVANSNPSEFTVVTTLRGLDLPSNNQETHSIEISAAPTDVGQRCADITVYGECSDPVTFRVCVNGLPPCNNYTLKDTVFDNTILNIKNTKTFTRVYENQTNTIRNMRIFLRENINNGFKLVSVKVGSITANVTNNTIDVPLAQFEKVEAVVEFTPKIIGTDCAKIMYATTNANVICDTTFTLICGDGIAPLDGRLDNQSWSCQRPNSAPVTKNVVFTNIGQLPIRINKIDLPNTSRFTLKTSAPSPIIAAGGTFNIAVDYVPDAATTHSATITIDASDENNVTQISRKATLTGNGCEPVITLSRECFPTVIIGKSDTKANAITIKNDGNFDMNVSNVAVNPNTEFSVQGFVPFVLAPDSSRTISMQFTPSGIGARTATVTVISDATETNKTIEICGTGLPEGSEIPMGSIYVCASKEIPFEFPTTVNPNEDITVSSSIINGDFSSFRIEPASQVIPRNTKGQWKITFSPQATGSLASALRFTTQGLGETQYALTGEATSTSLKLTMSPTEIKPIKIGAPQTLTFAVEAGADISILNIDEITVTLNYEPSMFNYRANSFSSSANTVVWDTPTENKNNGVLTVKGKGILPSPGKQNIFSLALDVLLGKTLNGTITSTITFPSEYSSCLTPVTGSQTKYESEEVCFAQGRLVTPGTAINTPQIFPNPTYSTARIDFTVGIDAPASIIIMNQLGEQVMTVIDTNLTMGNYSSVVDLSSFSNGLYYIVYTCGPYSFTQTMNVAK